MFVLTPIKQNEFKIIIKNYFDLIINYINYFNLIIILSILIMILTICLSLQLFFNILLIIINIEKL